MSEQIEIIDKESTKNAIIAIGQELIKRANDITNDLERVSSIEIYALLNPTEVANFDIKKNYTAYLEN